MNSNSNLLRCLNENWDWNGFWVVDVGVDWTVGTRTESKMMMPLLMLITDDYFT